MISAKLILVDPDSPRRKSVRVGKLPMTIGRGRDADLTLAHPMVSRMHCELYEAEGTLCLRDLESLNGTFVGETRITEASLESGDLLTIGSAKFELLIEPEDPILVPPQDENSESDIDAAGETDPDVSDETHDGTPSEPASETPMPAKAKSPPPRPQRAAEPESPIAKDEEPTIDFDDEVADLLMDDEEKKPKDASDDDLNQFLADFS